MAKESPFTISVALNIEAQTVDIKQYRKVKGDADNELIGERSYAVAELPQGAALKTLLYGASKKLQDSTSAESMVETRLQSMDEVWDRLKNDQWDKPREGGGPTVSAEVEALAALKGVSPAVIQATLRTLQPDVREKVLAHPSVKAKAAEIKAAREEASAVDLSDLAGPESEAA